MRSSRAACSSCGGPQRIDPRRLRIVPEIPKVVYLAPVIAVVAAATLIGGLLVKDTHVRSESQRQLQLTSIAQVRDA